MFKCFGYLYMFIFLLQSNGMPVFKRVVSICRSLSETLYYSTFHVTTYEHIHLRYCELVVSKKKPLLQFTVAVFFFAAVRSDGTNNTCCCVSFLSCFYCELVMSKKKPLLQFTVAVFFFAAVRSDGTNAVGVSSLSESLVLLLVFNF
ncbi:hypothetical protein Peur_062728 [Populus x canadensis]